MAIRLLRWFFLHVFFASIPILAPLALYHLYKPAKGWELHAGEVLFFTFMISSIACGEVIEWMMRVRGNSYTFRAILTLLFAAGALVSALLYVIELYENLNSTAKNGNLIGAATHAATNETVLLVAVVLAIVFLILGTVVEVAFHKAEGSRLWRLQY